MNCTVLQTIAQTEFQAVLIRLAEISMDESETEFSHQSGKIWDHSQILSLFYSQIYHTFFHKSDLAALFGVYSEFFQRTTQCVLAQCSIPYSRNRKQELNPQMLEKYK